MAEEDEHLRHYLQVVERVSEMARPATAEQLASPVPACPDWSVHQLLSHLVGLTEDWVNSDLDGYATPAWAQQQADRHSNEPIEEVLSVWATAVEHFARLTQSPLGSTPSRWAFGDAVTHESDLRPVLAPGTRPPSHAVSIGVQAVVSRWRGTLADASVAPLDIVASDLRTWAVGDPSQRGTGPAGTVTTTAYELFRALYGRRSRAQMETWHWTTDPAPYLDAGLPFPFTRPDVDLQD